MKNGKWKTENAPRGRSSAANHPFAVETVCPACGARAKRENAKFCLVCGKMLGEDYEPLDAIRASYHLQGKNFDFREIETRQKEAVANLFEQNKNSAAQTAWACLVYSTVPYLGILFVPLTFLIGGCGYLVAYRQPLLGGRKMALASVGLSFVVLLVQIFLWWLLYIIPELSK